MVGGRGVTLAGGEGGKLNVVPVPKERNGV